MKYLIFIMLGLVVNTVFACDEIKTEKQKDTCINSSNGIPWIINGKACCVKL